MAAYLTAGSAVADISPTEPQHLYGYPHVERVSTGVHDRLLSSALYLGDGREQLLLVANDIIFVPKDLVARARERIGQKTGVPAANILISATHTHSGPVTVGYLSNEGDPTVPDPDPDYLRQLEDGIVHAGQRAVAAAEAAELGLATADGAGIGTNRHDPNGPSDPEVPVLIVRRRQAGPVIAGMLVCSMHPTVLHEDSTLVSGDFPALARKYLIENGLGAPAVWLHHTGAAGNQSPRHVVRGNTFAEAERLGKQLGAAVQRAVAEVNFQTDVALGCHTRTVELPLRQGPSIDEAEQRLKTAQQRFDHLRQTGAPRTETRTAECDLFGAQETLTLARAAVTGRTRAAATACLPAEVQVLTIGPWRFVAWPGELFVEFALKIKSASPNTYVITLANGELQGYLVTRQAVTEGWYEAGNALFRSPDSGDLLVDATKQILDQRNGRGPARDPFAM